MKIKMTYIDIIIYQYIIVYCQYIFQLLLTNDMAKVIVSILSKIIVLVMLLLYIRKLFAKNSFWLIGSYILACIYILIQCMIFPDNVPVILEMSVDFLTLSLINFNLIINVEKYEELLSRFYKISFPLLFILCVAYGMSILVGNHKSTYNITYSYMMIFMIIVAIDSRKYIKFSIPHYLLLATSSVLFLLYGSRGGLLCVACYLLSQILMSKSKMKYIVLIFVLFFMKFYNIIFDFINQILAKIGIYSRTIYLLSNEMVYLSGRDVLQENIKIALEKSPVLGLGMGGDRIVNGGSGYYSHNLMLEILVDFGLYMGTFILGIFIVVLITFFFKCKNESMKKLGSIYFSYTIPMLMVSRSFWTEKEFWILLGILIIGVKCEKKRIRRNV